MGIKHTYQSATPDDPTDEISSARWNEVHAVDVSVDLPDNTTDPSAPTTGLKLYSKTRTGRRLAHFIGPSGVDSALQPAFFGNRIMLWTPGSGTGIGSSGLTPTTAATLSHPTPASTTLAESLYRTRFQTSTTAGNAAGARDAVNTIWGGNAAGRGGFFLHQRFCSGSIALAGGQVLCGLSSNTAALAAEPSSLADLLAVTKDIADTQWQFCRKTGAGAVQKVSLGLTIAVNQTLDLVIFRAPNSGTVFVTVRQHNFDGTFTTLLDTSYTTDIPAGATLLGRHFQVRNGSTAAAANADLVRSYVESDY